MPAANEHLNANNLNVPVFPTHLIGKDRGSAVATIASGQSLSGAVDIGNLTAVALVVGAAWTAAGVTFQVSLDNVTYVNLYDSAGEYTIASAQVGASRAIALDTTKLVGFRYLKVRSGTSGAAVNQTGGATVTVVGVG